MSDILNRQSQFSKKAALLILKAHEMGYIVSLGDAFRDPRCPYGSKSSKHRSRLAIDLNLFDRNGNYLSNTEDHKELGEWWEGQGGIWGGRFEDGNHYQAPDFEWIPHINGSKL